MHDRSLAGLSLSVSFRGQSELSLQTFFSDVLFRRLHGTLGSVTIHYSINVKFFELLQCFTFRIILKLFLVFLSSIPIMVIVVQVKNLMDTRLLNLGSF